MMQDDKFPTRLVQKFAHPVAVWVLFYKYSVKETSSYYYLWDYFSKGLHSLTSK